jgi:hypothetical protein
MIHADLLRPAPAFAQLLQYADNAQRRHARIDFNRQRLARVFIDDGECPKRLSCRQSVADKLQSSALIRSLGQIFLHGGEPPRAVLAPEAPQS